MVKKQIWVLRHAENKKVEDDLSLTERGKKKTNELGELIVSNGLTFPVLILCTPCLRAQETSDILKRAFEKPALGPVELIETMAMTFSDQEQAVQLISMISSLDDTTVTNIDTPNSIVLVCHKNHDAMQLLFALLDPAKFMLGENHDGTVDASEVDTLRHVLMAAVDTNGHESIDEFSYLEALHFEYLEQNWADFGFGCSKLVNRARPDKALSPDFI